MPFHYLCRFVPRLYTTSKMARKHRANKEILAPLRLSTTDADALARATQARVKQAREKDREKMEGETWVRELSEQWLQAVGQSRLVAAGSRLLWPRDNTSLVNMIAELMSVQNTRMEDSGPHKRALALQELRGLEMWPESQAKRLCTRSGKSMKSIQ